MVTTLQFRATTCLLLIREASKKTLLVVYILPGANKNISLVGKALGGGGVWY